MNVARLLLRCILLDDEVDDEEEEEDVDGVDVIGPDNRLPALLAVPPPNIDNDDVFNDNVDNGIFGDALGVTS